MSTTTAAETEIPSSRTEPDLDRVARGEPRGHIAGVPVYGWGQAPPYLRTQTQLGEDRLKLAEGQPVLAYIRTRKYGDVALYDPAGAVKMKPLPSSTKAKMEARRTCPECGKVRKYVVRGKRCSVCHTKAYEAQQRREARTCWDCREVFPRRLPQHHRCGACRRAQLVKQWQKAAEWVEQVTVCAGEGCSVKLVTKKEARAHQRQQGLTWGWWSRAAHWPLRCSLCRDAEERRQTEQRARWEREEQERREAERRAAEARVRWAAQALVDPDVVILDTETTGLLEDPDARIVEIAVIRPGGEVLLDTLINPGVPIPASASEIHGITDAHVQSAPSFSAVLDQLTDVLTGQRVLIYNDSFDVGMLTRELTFHHLGEAAADVVRTGKIPEDLREQWSQAVAWIEALTVEDVMIPYSDWVGEWDEYWGNNRWQKLHGGHRALGDGRAVVDCLRAMGRGYDTVPAGNGGLDEREAV